MKKISTVSFMFAAVALLLSTQPVFCKCKQPVLQSNLGKGGTCQRTHKANAGFVSEHFSGSKNCAKCHNGMEDANGEDVSIQKAWSATSMAHAFKDPYWRAKVKAEGNRFPQLKETIENICSRCHAPMANVEANYKGEDASIFGHGLSNPSNPHYDEAMDGVSCTLCHQIEDTPQLGTLDGFSGKFTTGTERKIYGPFLDVASYPMLRKSRYKIVYSEHMEKSKMCATCHNLKTPYLDENGEVIPQTPEEYFPEEMPFTEWEHSSVSQTKNCQDCHMKKTDGVTIASRPFWANTKREGFARHIFTGGNKLLLDILNNNRKALGVTASRESFDYTMAETDKKLNHAAKINATKKSLDSNGLLFTLNIQSIAGHKLPTAFLARRVILHVSVTDAEGNLVFESGRVNDDGSVVGANSDVNPMTYEPHYDTIVSDDQVQIYETVVHNNQDEITYTILRSAGFLKDNRILPKGFDKHDVPNDIRVVGDAYDDDNFIGGSDDISFHLSDLRGSGYTIKAELIYQAIANAHVLDVASDSSKEAADFKKMFDASQHKSTLMTSAEFSIGL